VRFVDHFVLSIAHLIILPNMLFSRRKQDRLIVYTPCSENSDIFVFFTYFSQFLYKVYETFNAYPLVNISTDGNLILTESVKILCVVA